MYVCIYVCMYVRTYVCIMYVRMYYVCMYVCRYVRMYMCVQRLKVAILPLDLPCSRPVTHSGEILTTGKSHGKKPDRFSLNDTDVKKVSRLKYATWNIRGLGEKEE